MISRFSIIAFVVSRKQTAAIVRESAISQRMSVCGAPKIMFPDKDVRLISGNFQGFCTERNIALRTDIPRHRQSIGEREDMDISAE